MSVLACAGVSTPHRAAERGGAPLHTWGPVSHLDARERASWCWPIEMHLDVLALESVPSLHEEHGVGHHSEANWTLECQGHLLHEAPPPPTPR